MKFKVLLAACVIALAGCANLAQNGPNASDANIIAGAETAYSIGKGLYDAGQLSDSEAEAAIQAIRAIHGFVTASRAAKAAGDEKSSAAYLRAAADALDALTARLLAKKG